MAEEKLEEGVYGENISEDKGTSVSGIREETVRAHPQPTGDAAADADGADAADEVKERGAESIESSPSVAQISDDTRANEAADTSGGGMGRDSVPRNEDDAPQGEFTPLDDESEKTPG